MLTLDQRLLLDRLDAYIDYCDSQGYQVASYSTYFINAIEFSIFDDIARLNVVYNLGLPILGNTYKCLNIFIYKVTAEHLDAFENSFFEAVI